MAKRKRKDARGQLVFTFEAEDGVGESSLKSGRRTKKSSSSGAGGKTKKKKKVTKKAGKKAPARPATPDDS